MAEIRESLGRHFPGPILNSLSRSHSAKMSMPRDHPGETSIAANMTVTNLREPVASVMGVIV
jgi:hypothetical protein